MATQGSSDIGYRTSGYVAADLLRRAHQDLVLQQFGQLHPIPKNSSATIKFRRYAALGVATTALTEGVTPSGNSVTSTDYSTTLSQYGDWVGITDQVADTHEDPIIREYSDILAQQAAETVETLLFNILKAGTNVYYANGSARNAVNTPLTLNLQRKITRGFKRQNAKRITKKLSSSVKMDTVNVKGGFIGVVHPDAESMIRGLAGFKDAIDYGSETPYMTEIGTVEDVRYLTSTIINPWDDAGGTKAGSGTTMISTTGTSADVYPVLYMAKDWFGVTPLKGVNGMTPFVKNPGESREGDQLGQRGWIGWKTYFTGLILNQVWGARAEIAIPELT